MANKTRPKKSRTRPGWFNGIPPPEPPYPTIEMPPVDPSLDRDALLLVRIRAALLLLDEIERRSHPFCAYEEGMYRFYHLSWKVYRLQKFVLDVTIALKKIALDGENLNPWYLEIVAEGTGREWHPDYNGEWQLHTRPIMEAFLHARYWLLLVRECAATPYAQRDSTADALLAVNQLFPSRSYHGSASRSWLLPHVP